MIYIKKNCEHIINEKKNLIEGIRLNEYGFGLKTDEKAKSVIDKQNERLNRALEELSDGLYSKETHFTMELIQNADDNKYFNDIPKISFIYDNERMIIRNNETGFTNEDIKAICDVGKSNKKKIQGYIGEKGIGFKSVFKISNEPHIYSNCFRFKFKRKNKTDKLGFVVPFWIDNKPEYIDNNETTIILPFINGFKSEIKKFDDAKDPMLLVFLNKLTKLDIWDQVINEKHCFEKEENNGYLIINHKISHGKEINNRRFVWKKMDYSINIVDIQEEKRKNIKETHIILAYPLNDDGTSKIEKQKIFAFLPIKSSEFKFVIQADFILISNREDIDLSKMWNQQIRDNISNAFIESLNIFKNDEKLKTSWYRYIPKENEITDDFLKPVVVTIHEKLKETECIFTDSEIWVKPEDAVWTPFEIQHLIPATIIGRKYYVHHDIKDVNILEELGVKVQKSYSSILTALKKNDFMKFKSQHWFNSLYEFLNDKLYIKEEWQDKEFSTLRIIKEENGSLELPSDLFIKPSNEQLKKYEKIPVVKYVDLNNISKKGKEFLENIGVNKSHDLEKIVEKILNAYKNKECNDWTDEQRRNCNKYIEVWLKENNWDVPQDKELWFIEVLTNNGWKRADESYFPDKKLKDVISENSSFVELEEDDEKNRKFLETIGVASFPRILIKEKISIQNTDDVNDIENYAEWLKKIRKREGNADEEQWDIYILDGFENCLQKKDTRISNILLNFLIDYWNDYYSTFTDCEYYYYFKNKQVMLPDKVPSYFAYMIKNSKWLPTTKGIKKPGSSIFRSFDVIKKFSNKFPCIEIESELLVKGKEFLDFIELGDDIDLDNLLKILHDIKNQNENNKFDFVLEIYEKIILQLEKSKNIKLTNHTSDLHLLSVNGNFYPIKELYWNDHPNAKYFKDIYFVYIPEELSGYHQKLLFEDFLDIDRISKTINTELNEVVTENKVDDFLTKTFNRRLKYIKSVFSYNNIQIPHNFLKNVTMYHADKIDIILMLSPSSNKTKIPQPVFIEDVKVFCDLDKEIIYKISDVDELDLAIAIEDSTGGKNIAVYVENVLKLPEDEITSYLSRLGIKLLDVKLTDHHESIIEKFDINSKDKKNNLLEKKPIEQKESLAERASCVYQQSESVSIKDFEIHKSQQEMDDGELSFEADISIDIPHYKKKKIRSILTERKQEVTSTIKKWYDFKCQICGESFITKSGNWYAEGHHVIPIKDERECEDIDQLGNVICVCTKCHKLMHHGKCELIGIDNNKKEWLFKKGEDGYYYLDILFKGLFEKNVFVSERNASIKYTKVHFNHLKKFLETHGNGDKIIS